MNKLMVIDGNSIVNRAFYGVSQNLTTRSGQPTNAILGFLNILNKLLDEEDPQALCVTFDRKAPTFRHLAYEGYKATRKGMPDELASQMPLLKDVLRAMNVPLYELDCWEADDLIGTISVKDTAAGWETAIVTGDKDSLQLVTDTATVKLVSTRMGRTTTKNMTPGSFREEYGFDPVHIVDLKALMGDASDNIPGVKGVGEKTAMALIRRYGSIDALYAALPDVEMAPGEPAKPGVVKSSRRGRTRPACPMIWHHPHRRPHRLHPGGQPAPSGGQQRPVPAVFGSGVLQAHRQVPPHRPPGEGAVQEAAPVTGVCESEVVETQERLDELLALWRGLDEVDVLALPSLDGVCVEWWESEGHSRAALLFSDRTPDYSGGLRALFARKSKRRSTAPRSCAAACWRRASPRGITFDTQVAAYLLAPTDGSYELEKLGLTYYNQEFPKASAYLEPGAFGPLGDWGAAAGALMSHCALVGALRTPCPPG